MTPIRILLIDNEPAFVQRVVDYLHQSPEFRVVATLTPEEVRRLAGRMLNLDVILIDSEIPQHDGLRIITQLRCTYPRLGIVALGWQANSLLCAAALQAGADGYLSKTHLGGALPAALRQSVRWHQRPESVVDLFSEALYAPDPNSACR